MDTRQVQKPRKQIPKRAEPPSPSQSVWKKTAFLWRWLGYTLATVCTLTLLTFMAFFAYVKVYPQEISQKISHVLYENTYAKLTFSGIDVALLPLPALSFADVHLEHPDFSLDVAYATVKPSLWALVHGRFSLGDISLWRPVFVLQEGLSKQSSPENTTPTPVVIEASSSQQPTPEKKSTAPTKETVASAPVQKVEGSAPAQSQQIAQASTAPSLVAKHLGDQVQSFFMSLKSFIPSYVYGSSLEILHGSVTLQQGDVRILCKDMNTALGLGSLGALDGNIHFEDTFAMQGETALAHIQGFTLTLSGDVDDSVELRIQSQADVEGLLADTHLDVFVSYTATEGLSHVVSKVLPTLTQSLLKKPTLGTDPLQASWNIKTRLIWEGVPIAVQSSGNMHGDLRGLVHIKSVRAQLEQDSVHLNAALQLSDLENPTLVGNIQVPKLSLTQWFGFARHMPPGLQRTLDDIKGELDFIITKEGLEVPRLSATAAEASFTGKGGVPSWSNAVVYLDILTPELYLGKVYPEAEGHKPTALTYVHTPLTPEPGTPEAAAAAGGISVSYDINVTAEKMYAWDLPMEGMRFRACPIELDREKFAKKHTNAAVLSGKVAKFFGGRAEGKALLYRSESDESAYDITALLRNVRAEKPVARILGRQLIGGRMSADASVTAKGVYAGEFLVSLGGTASLRIESGNFYSRSNRKVPFKVLTLAGTVGGRNPEKVTGDAWPSRLLYSGKWRGTLDTADISAKTSWNGALEFGGKDYGTVALRHIPGNVSVTFAPDLTTLPHPTQVDFTGELSLDTTKGVVSLRKGKGTVPSLANMQVSGFGSLNFARDITWTGSVQSSTSSISSVLAQLDTDGESLLPKTAPQHATLSMNMAYAKNLLRMEKIQMKLDSTTVTGKMQRTFTSNPAWGFELVANEFDFDKLIRGKNIRSGGVASSAVTTSAKSAEKPLSWKWLQNLKAKGTLRIGTFLMHKIRVNNVVMPVNIAASTLDCTPTKAKFYDGDAVLNFKGVVKNGVLQTQLGAVVKKANLFALSEDLQLETVIAGNTDVWISAQGPVRATSDIPKAFDGTWRLKVTEGFMQSRDKKGKLKGAPTYISNLSDTGVITKGVLHSHNFLLQGNGIAATGKGQVNLVNDTLDMRLVVSTGGLSDIPVQFYGDLSDPKRDVHTGAVLLSAIGSLGMGVFDIIGGVFGALFGLFK